MLTDLVEYLFRGIVEDLDLVERSELSEKLDIDVSIEDGELVCNYMASPIIRAMVKEELANSLASPDQYSSFDENTITIRNIALGDEVFELLNAYINDEKNEAIFSSVEVYKAFKKNFKNGSGRTRGAVPSSRPFITRFSTLS